MKFSIFDLRAQSGFDLFLQIRIRIPLNTRIRNPRLDYQFHKTAHFKWF